MSGLDQEPGCRKWDDLRCLLKWRHFGGTQLLALCKTVEAVTSAVMARVARLFPIEPWTV